MKKKIVVFSLVLSVCLLSISYVFAANEMNGVVNGARNIVGGAENVVEGAVSGIGNGIESTTSNMKNMTQNKTAGTATTTNGGNYTATRTATAVGTNNATFLGLSATAWTWLIMAIVGIVTIALIWAYSKQYDNDTITDDNNDKY